MGDRHGGGIKKDRIDDPLNLDNECERALTRYPLNLGLYSLLRLVAVASVRSLHR